MGNTRPTFCFFKKNRRPIGSNLFLGQKTNFALRWKSRLAPVNKEQSSSGINRQESKFCLTGYILPFVIGKP